MPRQIEIVMTVEIPDGFEVNDEYIPGDVELIILSGQRELRKHHPMYDDPDAAYIASNLEISDIRLLEI
jgi:hypothetical protein